MGEQIQSIFNNAIRKALRQGRLIESNEYEKRNTSYLIVRTPETPAVILRTRGDRHLDEIPRSEIGAMMNYLLREKSSLDIDQLIESVATAFKIKRVTENTRSMFLEIRHQI